MTYYVEIDDSIRPFIEEKMSNIDKLVYNTEEFNLFFGMEHKNIFAVSDDGRLLAFACIAVLHDGYKMCYTWCDKEGKRAYANGIDYMIARYNPMMFGQGALKFNKIKRIADE